MDESKVHRKAWELILEQVQCFMAIEHPKHQAVLIADDLSKQANRSLAMKHAYLQESGTANGIPLRNIVEMPLFVRSELSNGIQLADLVAYNIYRCFERREPDYSYFTKLLPYFWNNPYTDSNVCDGLEVWPPKSGLAGMVGALPIE